MKAKFKSTPILVQIVDLREKYGMDIHPVEVGGRRLDTLREDFFDNARNVSIDAGIFSPYDVALSGGEPYAVWH